MNETINQTQYGQIKVYHFLAGLQHQGYNIAIQKYIEFIINNDKKSVIVEKSIGTVKNKICKYKTFVSSKNEYNYKVSDLVKVYKNTFHKTIIMKPADR